MADPLTAPVRPASELATFDGPGGSSATVPTVTPPGASFLTPAQLAGLPVTRVGSWQLLARSADDAALLVGVDVSGCERLAALEVSLGTAAVVVTPRLRSPTAGTVCPALAVVARYVVDLGAPLGGRQLLHPPAS